MLYERPSRVGCAVDERAALIDMIEKGNVAGAVAATNHHLSAIEERLMIEAPPEKLAIDCRTLFAQQNRSGRCRHRPTTWCMTMTSPSRQTFSIICARTRLIPQVSAA